MWAIDIDSMTWHKPTCAGRGPGARYGHCAVVIDYKVYIFGGRGPRGLLYNDLWCLDVETWSWTLLPSTTAPPLARFGHAGVAVGGKFAVWGGWDGKSMYNDLWVYDVAGRQWLKPKITGSAPPARHGHSMVLSPAGHIIIFGGWAQSERGWPQYLSDTRVLDTASMAWIRPRISGAMPPGSYAHGAVMVGKYMVLLGGYQGNKVKPPAAAVDAKTLSEEADRGCQVVPETLPDMPPPVGFAQSPDGQEVPIGKHPCLWVLDTDADTDAGMSSGVAPNKRHGREELLEMRWIQPLTVGQPPGKRYGMGVVPVGPHVLILSGWDGNKALNDVLQVDMSALVGSVILPARDDGLMEGIEEESVPVMDG